MFRRSKHLSMIIDLKILFSPQSFGCLLNDRCNAHRFFLLLKKEFKLAFCLEVGKMPSSVANIQFDLNILH